LTSLRENSTKEKLLKEEIANKLMPSLSNLSKDINDKLSKFFQGDLNAQNWQPVTKQIRADIEEQKITREKLKEELIKLDVPTDRYIEDPVAVKWDKEQYDDLVAKNNELVGNIETEKGNLINLQKMICQKTDCQNDNWDELLNALRDKRERKVNDFKNITAEMIAKICVNNVVKLLQQEENHRIEDGLKSPEIKSLLHSITGSYKSINLDTESSLKVVTNDDEDFALSQLSTGAKEQVYLILRMAFASKALEDNQAFLIFDDAFQHSDWIRRPRLINEIISLADKGWQIFYLTMDDHIRDLFLKEGERLGSRFRYHALN